MTNSESIDLGAFRDLLLQMGARGAECLDFFSLAALADFLSEQGRTELVDGGWPRRKSGSVREKRYRGDWAASRYANAQGRTLDEIHADALEYHSELLHACPHTGRTFIFDDQQMRCHSCGAVATISVKEYCDIRDIQGTQFPDLSELDWRHPSTDQ